MCSIYLEVLTYEVGAVCVIREFPRYTLYGTIDPKPAADATPMLRTKIQSMELGRQPDVAAQLARVPREQWVYQV